MITSLLQICCGRFSVRTKTIDFTHHQKHSVPDKNQNL